MLRHVHHATVRLDELCAQLLARFQGRWVPGEGALALRHGAPAACRIIAPLDQAGSGAALARAAGCECRLDSPAT